MAGKAKGVESLSQRLLRAAKAVWPNLSLTDRDFLDFLTKHILTQDSSDPDLLLERASDLYLACACAKADERAMLAFQHNYLAGMKATLRGMNLPQANIEEVVQLVLEKLFVGDKKQAPKISQYSGQGALEDWLHIVTVRQALNWLRDYRKQGAMSFEALANRLSLGENQELSYLKNLYRRQFKEAFERAFETLNIRERNILRQHVLYEMSLSQMGDMFGVSRMMVSRWMAEIRKKLLQKTRRELSISLSVDRKEFNSIIHLIRSQLDVSICRFLKKKDESK